MRVALLGVAALIVSACGDSEPARNAAANPPASSQAHLFSAPAGSRPTSTTTTIEGKSGAILPSGRFVTPAGSETLLLAPYAHALCLSPDGRRALTVQLMGLQPQGIFPYSVALVALDGGTPSVSLTLVDATYNGCTFSADGSQFYVAGGDNGNVWIGDSSTGQWIGSINLSGPGHELPRPLLPVDPTLILRSFKGAFPGKMTLSPDGRYLYVVDQGAFKLHIVDTTQLQTGLPGAPILEPDNFAAVVGSAPTGHYPYAVATSPDGANVFVANIGVFRYTHLRPESPTGTLADYPLCYPAAGYPDEVLVDRTLTVRPVDPQNLPDAMREDDAIRCGYVAEERSVTVPAVGDPNALESSSVWVYSVGDPAAPTVSMRIKTGASIGDVEDGIATYGGSHPNAIVAGAKAIYVSLGNHDAVAVLDPVTFGEVARISLATIPGTDGIAKGVLPTELALSEDGTRLYVTEAGLNAIGVIDLGPQGGLDGEARLVGHIPTGWWPSGIAITPDARSLVVANAKGRGAGPAILAAPLPLLGYPAAIGPKNSTLSTLNRIPIPDEATLRDMTAQVLRNNGLVAGAPAQPGGPIPHRFGIRSDAIRHVVLINKENATHDLLLGHITQTRGGEPVEGLPANSIGQIATPNHTELALSFAFSDNFFLEPVSSSDGHRWMAGFYATEYQETHWPTAYGQKRAASGDDRQIIEAFPGRIAFSGVNESPEPIDYNKHGGVFLHLTRNGRTVMNFGNGTELANVDEGSAELAPTGTSEHVNIPMEKALRDNSDHLYAGFNTHIPDAPLPADPARYSRFGRFRQVFESQLVDRVTGECRLADYTTLFFPNDHGGGPTDIEAANPWAFERFVQDNDTALGLTVELISNSPCWKDTVIFVVEDDTQNGADHVDGHRSILIAISPWSKREHVSHVHASLPSVFKTTYLILGVTPLNQYDQVATDLRDLFSDAPDYTPYAFRPVTYIPGKSQQAEAWIRETRNVDFGEMDGDEVNLRNAIVRALGLPRTDARPLHETDPQAYSLHGVEQVLGTVRLYAGRSN
jgi:DNA-binding beta-propeller fold protein YncE